MKIKNEIVLKWVKECKDSSIESLIEFANSINEASSIYDAISSEDEEDDETLTAVRGKKIVVNDKTLIPYINSAYDRDLKDNKNIAIGCKFLHFALLDTSEVTIFDAAFAYLNIPDADLSTIVLTKAKSCAGMFFKSTFNNKSIRYWDFGQCKDFAYIFRDCPYSYGISNMKFNPDVPKNKLPKLYDTSDDEIIEKEASAAFDELNKIVPMKGVVAEHKFKTLLSYEQFVNEGIVDDVKSGIKKTTEKISGWFIAMKNKLGELFNSMSPISISNYVNTKNVKGVFAKTIGAEEFSTNAVEFKDNTEKYPDYFSNNERKNFETFANYVNSVKESISDGDTSKRIGYSAKAGGFKGKYQEVSTPVLRDEIEMLIENTEDPTTTPLFIFGSPGIGKTTIPKMIIEEFNKTAKNDKECKTLLVMDMSQISSDGLSIPMPEQLTLGEYLSAHNMDASKLGKKSLDIKINKSMDALKKGILPVYTPTGDPETDKTLDEIANGSVSPIYDKDGYDTGKFKINGNGGILMIDEFFRADPDIFKKMLTMLTDKKFGDAKLGSKWQIIACSNRPLDDDEVMDRWQFAMTALINRVDIKQFVPDFDVWTEWAKGHGFDETTLDFLASEKIDGEYINWHWMSPEEKNAIATGSGLSTTSWPSPRSWSDLMNKFKKVLNHKKLEFIDDLDKDTFLRTSSGFIGDEMAEKYYSYYKKYFKRKNSAGKYFEVDSVFNVKGYKSPEELSSTKFKDEMKTYIAKFSKTNYPTLEQFTNFIDYIIANYDRKDSGIMTPLVNNLCEEIDVDFKSPEFKGWKEVIVNSFFKNFDTLR